MASTQTQSDWRVGLTAMCLVVLSFAPTEVESQSALHLWATNARFLPTMTPLTRTRHAVTPNISALSVDTQSLTLALPGAAPVIAAKQLALLIGNNGVFWKGTIGKTGSATFTLVNDALVGGVVAPDGRRYRLRYLPTAGYQLEEIDWRYFEINHGTPTQEVESSTPPDTTCSADPGEVIDVLVVWTTNAVFNKGGPGDMNHAAALITQAETETNKALAASGVDNVRIRVVHVGHVEYRHEAKTLETVQADLATGADGLSEVHKLRHKYGADVVFLVTEISDQKYFTGQTAFTFQDFHRGRSDLLSSKVFAVISPWALTVPEAYAFAHEMGHLMGAQHDNASGAPFGHSLGHFSLPSNPAKADCPRGWKTIMATSGKCVSKGESCPTIGFWSNSKSHITYCNEPMGKADVEDNALTIMKTATTVANIRCSEPR